MTLLYILLATYLDIGFTFPGGGLERVVNIGKYLKISQKLYTAHNIGIYSYVRFTRFPSITSSLSVYDNSMGILVETPLNLLKTTVGVEIGLGEIKSMNDVFRLDLCPEIRKSVYTENYLGFSLSAPILFLKGSVIYSVNMGFYVSI